MKHDVGQSPPAFLFTLAREQNQFFVELAEALVYELRALGVSAEISVGDLPVPEQGLVHVILPPHEFESLSRYRPPAELLRRSVVISAEQPETHYFEANVALVRDAGAVFDINPRCVRAYQARGIDAKELALGYSRLWDRFATSGGEDGQLRSPMHAARERDIDIIFLGRLTPRRGRALAGYASILERFRCHLALSEEWRTRVGSGPAFVAGEDKRSLLARAKVLLNIHGEDQPYFEWLRIAEAVCAGCAVVSEHSSDIAPLEWGRHIVTGQLGSLGLLCAWLVDDGALRDQMRAEAYELLRRERPLSAAAHQLIAAGRTADAAPLDARTSLAARHERATRARAGTPAMFEYQPVPHPERSEGEAIVLRALKKQLLSLKSLERRLSRLERANSGLAEEPRTRVVADSRAWTEGGPRALTVIVPLYNQEREILAALGSLERSARDDWEAVVVDDASNDGGGDAVRSWIEQHQHRACRLVRHDLNRGLAAARNTGAAEARTDRLLMLDADNELRRTAMPRLMEALDADPEAGFAYGIIERFSVDGPEGLVSSFGWDPPRLRRGNYIDACALVRRQALNELGGYSSDQRLYGWEDYDLWVRMAEAGRHAAFVPEIIARYRVAPSSMIWEANLSTTDAFAALVEHAPKLMAGLRIPG
jgi:hypothetical protein